MRLKSCPAQPNNSDVAFNLPLTQLLSSKRFSITQFHGGPKYSYIKYKTYIQLSILTIVCLFNPQVTLLNFHFTETSTNCGSQKCITYLVHVLYVVCILYFVFCILYFVCIMFVFCNFSGVFFKAALPYTSPHPSNPKRKASLFGIVDCKF